MKPGAHTRPGTIPAQLERYTTFVVVRWKLAASSMLPVPL